MKIKSQFHLLLAGIIIIPLILVISILSQHYANSSERLILPGYDELVRNLDKELHLDVKSWQFIQEKLSRRPTDLEYLIFDNNKNLVLTNIQNFSNQDIFEFIYSTGKNYFYQIDTVYINEKDSFFVITRLPKARRLSFDKFKNPFFILAIILITLLIFCSIMFFLITRSITKSVTLLDDCTKRMASGDLDVEIEANGSNEIVSLTDSLNKMRLALREEEIRRSRFIMGLSHDLRTPIALIKGYAEAISDGMVDDSTMREKSVEIIINKADQLNERIDELIDFVKLYTNEWRQSLQSKNLKKVLNEFCKRLPMDAQLLNRTVEIDINLPDDFTVHMDESLFLRTLENLTNNAFRYTNDNGCVKIKSFIDEKTKFAVIIIKDDGQGINKKDLPFIFDTLYRGTNSRREDGKGLGLSIVKTVVDSHGWKLDVNTQVGKGSEFVLQLGM
ncbi:MAG: HAMP domain-containing histidine kinase [Spirochaetaceae bacterium]|nr:HAMP domain-containing histidine kinase [Spirochaetaceae bacterium]